MALEDVGVRLIAENEAAFNKSLADAQKSIDHLDTSIKKTEATQKSSSQASDKMSQSLKKMGEAVVAAFAVEKIVEFGRQTITAASDMNETLSKSQVVFGDLAGEIEKMGDQAAESMGLSKQEAIAAAATYGNLFTAMGLGGKVSADMSMNLVQLASDLASFNNIPVADALEKLRAGLVGEAEPLKSLGINLNEATLKAKAMELGLSNGKGTLDAAAKAQAAYAIMLEQSSKAQGDFARTSDGLANQQRILEANFKNLQVEIGNKLLPAFLGIVKVGNQVLGTIDQLIERGSGYTSTLIAHEKEVRKTARSYEEYRTEMERSTKIAGWEIDAQGRLYRAVVTGAGATIEYNDALQLENDALFWGKQLLDRYGDSQNDVGTHMRVLTVETGLSIDGLSRQNDAYKQFADLMEMDVQKSLKNAGLAMSDLKKAMSGAVGKELADYNKSYQDLNGELETTKSKMSELLKVKGPWTPEQQTAYGNLLTQQDTIKTKIQEIQTAHEKATAQWLLDDLMVRLSLDGELTQAEQDFAQEFAYQHGLIDQATYTSIEKNKEFLASLNGAAPTWEAWEKYIKNLGTAWNNIPTEKTTTYTVKTVRIGDNPADNSKLPLPGPPGWGSGGSGGAQANGGDYMVTKPTWFLAGEAGPERALFIPQSAGPTTNNYNNNYNLSVMTSQSPQVIQQSFAMMQLLAG